MRFSIAQLAGARYEKYAQDLTDATASVLGVWGQKTSIDVEAFLAPENRIGPTMEPIMTSSTDQNYQNTQNDQASKTCPNCGRIIADTDRFCMGCDIALFAQIKICSNCGAQLPCDAAFCSACGTRL